MSRRSNIFISGSSTPAYGTDGLTPILSNVSSTRPVATLGTSVTPAQNAYGSYAQILTALPSAAYGLLLQIHSNATSANCKNTIITIGVDTAGGTSYTAVINHLIASDAPALNLGLGIIYYFPLYIASGSTVAAKASVDNATVGTVRVIATAYGNPSSPSTQPVITFVETLGATVASSSGTAVTSGTVAEGAWTALGTTVASTWWHQYGFGCSSAAMGGVIYTADIASGPAASEVVISQDMIINTSTAESLQYVCPPGKKILAGGTAISGRLQCSAAVDTGLSMIAYCGG